MTHATYAPHVDAHAHLDSSSDHELSAELDEIDRCRILTVGIPDT